MNKLSTVKACNIRSALSNLHILTSGLNKHAQCNGDRKEPAKLRTRREGRLTELQSRDNGYYDPFVLQSREIEIKL